MLDLTEAPKDVQDAAAFCEACASVGKKPPADLLAFLQSWVARQQAQDRYGK